MPAVLRKMVYCAVLIFLVPCAGQQPRSELKEIKNDPTLHWAVMATGGKKLNQVSAYSTWVSLTYASFFLP